MDVLLGNNGPTLLPTVLMSGIRIIIISRISGGGSGGGGGGVGV